MSRWTSEERALRALRYDPAKDPHGRGDHYVFEGDSGFGGRVYKSGWRTWQQAGMCRDPDTGKRRTTFIECGQIGTTSMRDARLVAAAVKIELAHGINRNSVKREARADKHEVQTLADTSLRDAMKFWNENRNCAPSSKATLHSLMTSNFGALLDRPLLDITTTELRKAIAAAVARVQADERERIAKVAKLSAEERLLKAVPGYYCGEKTSRDVQENFHRVRAYWVRQHAGELHAAGITRRPPPCPTLALIDDRVAPTQRVKSIPAGDLAKLLASLSSYDGNQLHVQLVKLLLATGARVGALLSARWEHVQEDRQRIVIPADVERSKVRWNKRGLEHMAQVFPITPAIAAILKALKTERELYYTEPEESPWLFPSRESKTGHLVEEKACTLSLRRHSGVRFTLHQLRHCVASTAENLNYSHGEIAELLGHGRGDVTARYIDEQVKRHSRMLTAISREITKIYSRPRA
jgi:integrase